MTAKLLYHAVLIELNKENAPNILLEEFNYFANKALYLYVNKRYNIYDINQQTTDDLRVLKSTTVLKPTKSEDIYSDFSNSPIATYYVILPSDYLHMLNCICIYKVKKTWNCYDVDDTWRAPAKRLTADAFSQILDNFWNKPTHNKPYYYIHNINKSVKPEVEGREYIPTEVKDVTINYVEYDTDEVVTENIPLTYFDNGNIKTASCSVIDKKGNYGRIIFQFQLRDNVDKEKLNSADFLFYIPEDAEDAEGYYKDMNEKSSITPIPFPQIPSSLIYVKDNIKDVHGNPIAKADLNNTFIDIGNGNKISNVERGASIRYGNSSEVRCEIRYGSDDSIFELTKVYIDYIKAPQNIRLTVKQLDSTEDISLVLEYPDYVCQEITNELVHIIMENIGDLRILTHPVVSLSIANPAQQLTETVAQPQQ